VVLSLWCYWEIVEPFRAQLEEVVLLGEKREVTLKGTLGLYTPPLSSLSLPNAMR
jgi:hypothetical protein